MRLDGTTRAINMHSINLLRNLVRPGVQVIEKQTAVRALCTMVGDQPKRPIGFNKQFYTNKMTVTGIVGNHPFATADGMFNLFYVQTNLDVPKELCGCVADSKRFSTIHNVRLAADHPCWDIRKGDHVYVEGPLIMFKMGERTVHQILAENMQMVNRKHQREINASKPVEDTGTLEEGEEEVAEDEAEVAQDEKKDFH